MGAKADGSKSKDFSTTNQAPLHGMYGEVLIQVAQARPEESTMQPSKLKGVTDNSRILRILQIS